MVDQIKSLFVVIFYINKNLQTILVNAMDPHLLISILIDIMDSMNINNFKNYLLYPQWGKLRNGLHIIDGSRGEITMDQLFDRFTEKDFVTPQNLNDKIAY
ncbi:uncharacterized protein LOC126895288 isoform X4 [Daktulosphaira vitifoliae]|uniref:uncharacterized protein LOC126895288 isoform X4 n=1 Tax=Daktulosphaira vitifoliae TaxID=58002 RepID=UPI0021AAE96F|nr:uncharacterized protein LOC126895288 isoform X4 [Daktulosphaira vitifoliae]